jgi:hypothetical protein
LNRKHLSNHYGKPYTSIEAKLPKIVKSSSSTESSMLQTLYSSNKLSPKVIKCHEDSDNTNSKGKSSSKSSLWGSANLSPGIEKLLNAMNLCDDSKSLIVSLNMCSIKNMIYLSNLELDELSS